jgi:hypothetical protein
MVINVYINIYTIIYRYLKEIYLLKCIIEMYKK